MNRDEASTAHLLRLLSESDSEGLGYGELIARSSRRLMSLTRSMLKDYSRLRRWEQTDDVFQSAVLRLYQSLSEVHPTSVRDFLALATTQIRRTLIDLSRHHFGPEGSASRHNTEVVSGGAERIDAMSSTPDRRSPQPESLQQWTEFHEAIERLAAEQREVFELIWYAGLQQREVAEVLECSLPTVQRRWYASQIALSQILSEAPPVIEEGSGHE